MKMEHQLGCYIPLRARKRKWIEWRRPFSIHRISSQ